MNDKAVEAGEYYNEKLKFVDEEICKLMKQRKELSNGNPGIPSSKYIADWAQDYELYEEQLVSLFSLLEQDEHFKPEVIPVNFQKNILVTKAVEHGDIVISIPFIKQYENASVVSINIHWVINEIDKSHMWNYLQPFDFDIFWELYVGNQFECRTNGGGGTDEQYNYNIVISPALPDDLSNITFTFKEYKRPFRKNPTGRELKIELG